MTFVIHPSLSVHVGDWLKTELIEPSAIGVDALADHLAVPGE